MIAHASNPSTCAAEQEDEFEVNLDYMMSSRPAWTYMSQKAKKRKKNNQIM